MEDRTVEGPSSVKWSALCAGKQLRFLHVMGIWLDFFSFLGFGSKSLLAQPSVRALVFACTLGYRRWVLDWALAEKMVEVAITVSLS